MDMEDIEALIHNKPAVDVDHHPRSAGMTLRQRFDRWMHFLSVDKVPNFEFGYWAQTLKNWHQQGLPNWVCDQDSAYKFFGIENFSCAPVVMAQHGNFSYRVIEEDEDYVTYVDACTGATCRINKKGDQSIPHYLDFKLKDRKDLVDFLDKYDPETSGRFPDDWQKQCRSWLHRTEPKGIFFGSLMGIPRNYMGFEEYAMTCLEDPELHEELVEKITQCIEVNLARALKDFQPDFAQGWEDICFNSGPICTPTYMKEMIVPRYKRITKLLNRAGCSVIQTDCDGNINPIVDQFLEGGINCMFPVEVHGGTDPVALRQRFGKDILFWGGIDKMVLSKNKDAVEKELQRIKSTVCEGGFIPTVDHRVQADATLENYVYYMERKRELFNVGGPEPMYKEMGWGVDGLSLSKSYIDQTVLSA